MRLLELHSSKAYANDALLAWALSAFQSPALALARFDDAAFATLGTRVRSRRARAVGLVGEYAASRGVSPAELESLLGNLALLARASITRLERLAGLARRPHVATLCRWSPRSSA